MADRHHRRLAARSGLAETSSAAVAGGPPWFALVFALPPLRYNCCPEFRSSHWYLTGNGRARQEVGVAVMGAQEVRLARHRPRLVARRDLISEGSMTAAVDVAAQRLLVMALGKPLGSGRSGFVENLEAGGVPTR